MNVRQYLSAVVVFVALFAITESCNVELIARGNPSNLTSPGYPTKNYPSNLTCWWKIQASDEENNVVVKVLYSAIETSKNCVYDSLSFYDGPSSADRSLARICGHEQTMVVSSGRVMYILFKTDNDHEMRGFHLQFYETTKCGGSFTVTPDKAVFHSPGHPVQYFNNQNCTWLFTAKNPTDTIVVVFDNMNVQSTDGCVSDSVTVFNDHEGDENQFLGTFCGDTYPTFQSSKDKLRIDFKTDGSVVGNGFTFHYKTVEAGVCNLTVMPFNTPLYIVSPGYPDEYSNDLDCMWMMNEYFLMGNIEVDVVDSSIEGDYPHCNDSLTVYSGSNQKARKLGTVCGNMTSTYTSTNMGLTVEFKTNDDVVDKGFRIRYKTVPAPVVPTSSQCGGTLTAQITDSYIQSPSYPYSYPNNALCIWTLTAFSSNMMIRLEALYSQLEDSSLCQYDSVTVYDGVGSRSSTMLKKWCGNTRPTVQSTGPSMTVVFKSDTSVTKNGFRLKYFVTNAQLTCGARLSASSRIQYLTSPGYPLNYQNNMDCAWTITSSSGIVITITTMDLEQSNNCIYDYLAVTSGPGTDSVVLQKLCGHHSNVIINTGSMATIKFHSDGSTTEQGFQISYKAANQGSCGGQLTALSTDKVLTSPGYPNNYQNNLDCAWIITTAHSHIKITIINLDIESHADCDYDYLKIIDGSSSISSTLATLCGAQTSSSYFSSGSSAVVKFHSDGSNSGKGFRLTYRGVAQSQCGVGSLVADATTRFLTSPNYPSHYFNNMDCTWTIATDLTNIRVRFLDMHLESNSQCSYDKVTVYDGPSLSSNILGTICGTAIRTYVSTGSSVTIKFSSDTSNTYRGFKLSYIGGEFVSCGISDLSASSVPGTLQSPNYPLDYPDNAECSWTISTIDSDYIVSLDVTTSDLEQSSGCIYDYFEVFDGSSDIAPSLGRYCGYSVPTLSSTGQYMYIKFKSDGSTTGSGFSMTYKSVYQGYVPDIPDIPTIPNINFDTDDDDDDSNAGPIAGGTVGGIFFIVFIMALALRANRRRYTPFVSQATTTSATMTKW